MAGPATGVLTVWPEMADGARTSETRKNAATHELLTTSRPDMKRRFHIVAASIRQFVPICRGVTRGVGNRGATSVAFRQETGAGEDWR